MFSITPKEAALTEYKANEAAAASTKAKDKDWVWKVTRRGDKAKVKHTS